MNTKRRNRQIGHTRLFVVGALVVTILIIIFAAVHWSDERVVKRKHEALINAIEKRSRARVMRLMADDYSDRFKFTKEDASLAWRDATGHFMVLIVSAENPEFVFEGNRATVTVMMRLGGKALGPVGQEVMTRANQLKTPWIFTWEDQGFGSGWKLIRMENESIPDDVYGYKPGDIQRMMDGDNL